MKKVLLPLVAIAICFSFSQCKSKEEKANDLIKDYMFKNLFDFESYQPIETKIDSAFHTAYSDTANMGYAYAILLCQEELGKLQSKYASIQSSIDIWCDGSSYYNKYIHSKCQECLDEALENLDGQKFWIGKTEVYRDSLINNSDTIRKKFIGWEVTHDFRCKTKGGNPDIGHYVFIMDKDVKKILSQKDKDDKDEIKLNSIIKESLEMTEEERAKIKDFVNKKNNEKE